MKVLITGVTGQDGSYLADYLLKCGYDIYGLIPHRNNPNLNNIEHIRDKIHLLSGDMTDGASLAKAISDVRPHYIYNLAAQSFVKQSWDLPMLTMDVNCGGLTRILEAVISHRLTDVKIYQASTSEMFGNSSGTAAQNEQTRFQPASPYGVSKTAAHMLAHSYRESHGIFISCGILFNHESIRRGEHFVSQKIAKAAASIKLGLQSELRLGNIDTKRDWGHAPDYVALMQRMLQEAQPDDYVIGTGESHSVREFCQAAFDVVGISQWEKYVVYDVQFSRPTDVQYLLADPSKARQELGWQPAVTFYELVELMTSYWLRELQVHRS